jgi:PAS domain-containing protein
MKMLSNVLKPSPEFDLVEGIVSYLTDLSVKVGPSGTILGITTREKNGVFSALYKHIGRPLDRVLTPESAEKLQNRFQALREGLRSSVDQPQVWCELVHKIDGSGLETPVRYSIHWLKSEDQFLLLGIDQRPVIELQQQLVQAQIAMERDYESRRELDTQFRILMEETKDAFLFVSASTRKITDISAAAANLLGISRTNAIGRDVGAELSGLTSSDLINAAANTSADEPAPRLEVSARRTMQSFKL